MIFATTLLKENLILIYCLLIQTVLLMKWNQKMFMKNFLNTDTCLTLVNISQFFFDPTYKRVIGQAKDELKGIPINKFIGLKSKMQCIVSDDETRVSTAKGVNIFNEHEDVLFNEIFIRHKMKTTQSKLHKIGTYNVCKLSLPCFDDKRWTLNNGIKTLAYFPKDLKSWYFVDNLHI